MPAGDLFEFFFCAEDDGGLNDMAKNIWRGDAQALPQITDCDFGTVTAAESFGLTINRKTISYTVTSAVSDSARLAELIAALEELIGQYSNDIPEFAEISAEAYPSTGTATGLRITGPVDGKPVTIESWSGGSTVTLTEYQAPTGPNWWSEANNWTSGSVPTTGDEAIFQDSDVDCLYGLEESSADTLLKLRIKASYTGKIGLPVWTGDYYEYRPRFLKCGMTTVVIGEGEGEGSQLIKLDASNIQTTIAVAISGTPASGESAIYVKGTHASNKLYVYRGSVGVANEREDGEATFTLISTSYRESIDSDVDLKIGTGSTITTLTKNGGKAEMACGATTITNKAGELRIQEGDITTLNIDGGKTYYNGGGTITTAKVGYEAEFLMVEDVRAKTLTNVKMERGSILRETNGVATFTNGIVARKCNVDDITVETRDSVAISTDFT